MPPWNWERLIAFVHDSRPPFERDRGTAFNYLEVLVVILEEVNSVARVQGRRAALQKRPCANAEERRRHRSRDVHRRRLLIDTCRRNPTARLGPRGYASRSPCLRIKE